MQTGGIHKEIMSSPNIDNYNMESNTLFIRDQSVTDLACNQHYVQNVWLALTGEVADKILLDNKIRQLSADFFDSGQIDRLRAFTGQLNAGAFRDAFSRFMMLLIHLDYDQNSTKAITPDESLQIISALPAILCLARTTNSVPNLSPVTDCDNFCRAFWETLSSSSSDMTSDNMSFIMSLLLGGFGVVAPTTAALRFVASTKNTVNFALVGALCASGRAHLGACKFASQRLRGCYETLLAGKTKLAAVEYCGSKPWPGFGHPIMPEDPRVNVFFERMGNIFAPFEKLARAIGQKNALKPNVDFLIASVIIHYRIDASVAVLAFFVCRAPILLAHYREKFQAHAFGMPSKDLREKYNEVPKNWL